MGQFTFAINQSFKENVDKHSYKLEHGQKMSDKVFSYQEKFNLKDLAKNFCNYLKTQGVDVKQVKDIKSEHVQSFLNSKIGNCTQNTINVYASQLHKLELLCNKAYPSFKAEWHKDVIIPQAIKKADSSRGVNSVISKEDYAKILNYAKENPSQSADAIRLQEKLGIRIEELARIKVKNIDFNQKILILDNTKGGKTLTRQLDSKTLNLFKEIVDKHYATDRLFSVSGASINKWLNRVQDKLGLEKHSNHDLRRYLAQSKYDEYRKEGYTKKEALQKTSEWLNHKGSREEMLKKSYIKVW